MLKHAIAGLVLFTAVSGHARVCAESGSIHLRRPQSARRRDRPEWRRGDLHLRCRREPAVDHADGLNHGVGHRVLARQRRRRRHRDDQRHRVLVDSELERHHVQRNRGDGVHRDGQSTGRHGPIRRHDRHDRCDLSRGLSDEPNGVYCRWRQSRPDDYQFFADRRRRRDRGHRDRHELDTALPNDRTRFNATYTTLSSGTSTNLSTAVPSSTGSGHISVTTPYGTAVSTTDFLNPPSPYGVSDVQVFGRIPFATATAVTMSTANKVGVMLFDSSPGHRLSVRGTNGVSGQVAGCNISATLSNPNATALVTPTCMDANLGVDYMDAVAAPASGTYSLLVAPAAGVTGGVTLTVYDVPADVTGTITPGGSSATVTTTTPDRTGRSRSGNGGPPDVAPEFRAASAVKLTGAMSA